MLFTTIIFGLLQIINRKRIKKRLSIYRKPFQYLVHNVFAVLAHLTYFFQFLFINKFDFASIQCNYTFGNKRR